MDKDWAWLSLFGIAGASAQLWGKLVGNPIYDNSYLPMVPLAISLVILRRISPGDDSGESSTKTKRK